MKDDGQGSIAQGGATVTASGHAPLKRRAARRRSVAVSGADTFLGRNVVALLEEDERVGRVVLLDVRCPRTAGNKSIFYELDLTQPGVESRIAEILHAEQVDTLVHLAFVASPTAATAWAHELESVGTMHLLAACARHRLPKLVMRSSVLAYGPHPGNPGFLSEDRPLRGLPGAPWIEDKVDVEQQLQRYADEHPECCVTVLRLSPLLGPTVDNYVTRWLSRRLPPTVLGYDPLIQLIHEVDAVAACKLAIDRDAPGVYNVVGEGVLPISTLVRLAGRLPLPIPYGVFRRVAGLLWVAQLSEAPAAFVAALRYPCVADGRKAREALGFRPVYSTRDAVLDFEGALRLREARMLREATS
jgi:UDP-glucose 4-epimerase